MANPNTKFPAVAATLCVETTVSGEPRCKSHGGVWVYALAGCQTKSVLNEILDERHAQFSEYGTNEELDFGTGRHAAWLKPVTTEDARGIEALFRTEYESFEIVNGAPTFMHLLREELAEAFLEDDPATLRAELIQVAAVAVSWVEKIDKRKALATAAVASTVSNVANELRVSGA